MKLRDQWREYGFKPLALMNEDELRKFGVILEKWYKRKKNDPKNFVLECACKKSNRPQMHVRKSSTGRLTIANNPGRNKDQNAHDFQCPLNLSNQGYKGILRTKGIEIDDEGDISCTIKNTKIDTGNTTKSTPSPSGVQGGRGGGSPHIQGESALRSLLDTWLQEANIHYYRPDQARNLRTRILRLMCKTTIKYKDSSQNQTIKLNKNNSYIAHTGFGYDFRKHQVVIGWGFKNSPIMLLDRGLVTIPLYSVDDRVTKVQDITVWQSVFNRAPLTDRDVDSGYWMLIRVMNDEGNLVDSELIFEPAESLSGIPVESSNEEVMVRLLQEQGKTFKKPLIGNITELFLDQRPDIILYEPEKIYIIEVAGYDNQNYLENLEKKKAAYLERDYGYIQWNALTTNIQDVALPTAKCPKELK